MDIQNSAISNRPSKWFAIMQKYLGSFYCIKLQISFLASCVGVTIIILALFCASEADNYRTVLFGKRLLYIPFIYEAGITPKRSSSDYAAFTIGLLLPELVPGASDIGEFQRVGWHRQLRVLVENGVHYQDSAIIKNELLRWGRIDVSNFVLEGGCKHYRGMMTVAEDLYVCEAEGRIINVTCKDLSDGPRPYCNVFDNIFDSAGITYSYSRDYVGNAISIDTRLRAIVESFATKPNETKH